MLGDWLGKANIPNIVALGGVGMAIATGWGKVQGIDSLEQRLIRAETTLISHSHYIQALQKNELQFDETLKTINSTLVELNGTVRELKGIVESSRQ
ncbi:TPA: hypothetical protein ACPVXB_001030 [Vibrio parahaemolyticus]